MNLKISEINVIVINDFSNINGGAAKIAIETAIGLSKFECVKVYFFCATGSIDPELLNSGIEDIYHLEQNEAIKNPNKYHGILNGIFNIKSYQKISNILDNFNPNNTIIHVHGWTKSLSFSPIYACLKKKFHLIITLHDFFIACPNGGFYNYHKAEICTKIPLSLDCLTTNCDSRNYKIKLYRFTRTFLQNFIFNIYRKQINLISLSKLSYNILEPYIEKFNNISFIENPIDLERNGKADAIKNTNCIFIGRLSGEKGVEYFCEALKSLNLHNGIVVGEGDKLNELKIKYPMVKFLGWKTKEEIYTLLIKSRFLVFPSVWYETYGLVVQEAASYGIPSIVSDCSAAKELVTNNFDGLHFQAKNITQLSKCIDLLMTDNNLLHKLSLNAYSRFWNKNRSRSDYSTKVLSFYNMILNS
ncbi:glycosyltransferase [Pedobacter cryophilus]|uniref:Glycosyltransferase n=1 Tax=Pedobacter cryophilus TaxID=2571271 RepID=A0A4V5NXR1_9SPHI|nr:glycosyltransferase [Pedobacter cryophilus]TKC00461.1 glycosyltransferase [Pedobacter cryophilus]